MMNTEQRIRQVLHAEVRRCHLLNPERSGNGVAGDSFRHWQGPQCS